MGDARERSKAWRAANQDRVLAYRKAYWAKNRDRMLDTARRWKEKNRERVRAYSSEYRASHPEWAKAQDSKRWRTDRKKEQARKKKYRKTERAKEYNRLWRANNYDALAQRKKERNRVNAPKSREKQTAKRYSMSLSELRSFRAAHPVCDICGGTPKCVDHHHDTGLIRGHLCSRCNLGLGQFSDDPARLRAAAEYLEKHQPVLKLLG